MVSSKIYRHYKFGNFGPELREIQTSVYNMSVRKDALSGLLGL